MLDMSQEVVVATKTGMEDTISHLKAEFKNIRTGRANPAILDSVLVEVYGSSMKIRDLANVTVPESRQLLITPYDANTCGAIGKAIEKANLGIRPIVDANVVRLNVPTMDEATRKEMSKLASRKTEEAKISIRDWRRKANEELKVKKSNTQISEDDQKRLEKEVQILTDKYCKLADDLFKEKEKEILTV
jgi:ribosome recycling factor